jgi:hypothetical protein
LLAHASEIPNPDTSLLLLDNVIDNGNDKDVDLLIRDEVILVIDDMIQFIELKHSLPTLDTIAETFQSTNGNMNTVLSATSLSDINVQTSVPSSNIDDDLIRQMVKQTLEEMTELVARQQQLAELLKINFNMNLETMITNTPLPKVDIDNRVETIDLKNATFSVNTDNKSPELASPNINCDISSNMSITSIVDSMSELSMPALSIPKDKSRKSVQFTILDNDEASEMSLNTANIEDSPVEINETGIVVVDPKNEENNNIKFGISEPESPKSLVLGIRNPDDLKTDVNYWQTNDFLRQRTDEEKLLSKMKRLPFLRDHYQTLQYGKPYVYVKKQVEEIKLLKEDFKEDFFDFIEPLVKQFEKLMVRARPHLLVVRKEMNDILQLLTKLVKELVPFTKAHILPKLVLALQMLDRASKQSQLSMSVILRDMKDKVNKNNNVNTGNNDLNNNMIDSPLMIENVQDEQQRMDEVIAVLNNIINAIISAGEYYTDIYILS